MSQLNKLYKKSDRFECNPLSVLHYTSTEFTFCVPSEWLIPRHTFEIPSTIYYADQNAKKKVRSNYPDWWEVQNMLSVMVIFSNIKTMVGDTSYNNKTKKKSLENQRRRRRRRRKRVYIRVQSKSTAALSFEERNINENTKLVCSNSLKRCCYIMNFIKI